MFEVKYCTMRYCGESFVSLVLKLEFVVTMENDDESSCSSSSGSEIVGWILSGSPNKPVNILASYKVPSHVRKPIFIDLTYDGER